MYTDAELVETVKSLQHADPKERAAMLKALWAWPARDKRLWPHLEALLQDTSPCMFGTPPRFAEIRWLAAQALAADYRASSLQRTIRLRQVVVPLTAEELLRAAHEAGLVVTDAQDSILAAFATLQRTGKLKVADLEVSAK